MNKWSVSAPLLPLAIGIPALEILTRSGKIPPYLVAPPSEVFLCLLNNSGNLWPGFFSTAGNALAGFALAVGIGLILGIIFSASRWMERIFYPYALFFQTVPIISVAPLLVIWLGYGNPTVIGSAFIVAIFPIIATTLSGLTAVDPGLLDLFKLYGSSPFQLYTQLKLPFAIPQIMTGARVAGGLAVVGAIVGEFITGGGLGGVIDVARTQLRMDQVFAAILLSSALGFLFFFAITALSKILLRNRGTSVRV